MDAQLQTWLESQDSGANAMVKKVFMHLEG